MKTRPVVTVLFRADRLRDPTKLIVAFRSFAEVPKNLGQLIKTFQS